MSAAAPIHLIPEKIGALARAVAAGGRTVTRAFVDRWSGPPETAQTAYVRSADCQFRLTFTRSASSTILWVFHAEGPAKVIFDAKVSFTIGASSDLGPSSPAQAIEDIGVVFVLPSFLIPFPTRAQLDRFGFGTTSTPDNTMLLRLGPNHSDILAVMNPEAGKKASVRYSPSEVPGPVEPDRGKYSLAWVVSFIRTLGSWMDSDLSASEMRQPLAPSDEQSVTGVLFYLLEAFVKSRGALSHPEAAVLRLPDIFQKTYAVNRYQADLKLHLGHDGTLSDADDFETSQLTLRLRVRNADSRAAEITAIPNELSVSDRLAASFAAVLQFNVQDKMWAHLLHVDRVFVRPFFQSAEAKAVVFRIARDKSADTDVVILTGMLQGFVRTVVLSARFTVDMSQDPPAVDLPDTRSIEILAIAPGDGANGTVGIDAVKFILRYLVNLRHWIGVLG